jgi:hypothetical protein
VSRAHTRLTVSGRAESVRGAVIEGRPVRGVVVELNVSRRLYQGRRGCPLHL